ncbi:Uncharacterised protein [Mycobacterium tuberculosis]|nr:Uncharacterised protein [Mycobacterium tuberculosis]
MVIFTVVVVVGIVGIVEVVVTGGSVVVVVDGGAVVVVVVGDGLGVVVTGGAVVVVTTCVGGGGAGATVVGAGAALGSGATVDGGGGGVGARELGTTDPGGIGARPGTIGVGSGLGRLSMAVNVNATPPIAVMATTADTPMSNCDTRIRRHAGPLGGSTAFRRIDQQGPPSLYESPSKRAGASLGKSVCDQANSRSVKASWSMTMTSPAGSSMTLVPAAAAVARPMDVRVRESRSPPRLASSNAPIAAAHPGCDAVSTGRRVWNERR